MKFKLLYENIYNESESYVKRRSWIASYRYTTRRRKPEDLDFIRHKRENFKTHTSHTIRRECSLEINDCQS